jgi:hypothetical protein
MPVLCTASWHNSGKRTGTRVGLDDDNREGERKPIPTKSVVCLTAKISSHRLPQSLAGVPTDSVFWREPPNIEVSIANVIDIPAVVTRGSQVHV